MALSASFATRHNDNRFFKPSVSKRAQRGALPGSMVFTVVCSRNARWFSNWCCYYISYSLIRFLLRKKLFTDGIDDITVYVISWLRTPRAFSHFTWPIRLGSQSPDIIYCLGSETSQYVLMFPCWLWFGLLKNDQTRETALRHLLAFSLVFLTLFQFNSVTFPLQ